MADIIRFTNTPQEFALASPAGKPVKGSFGDQFLHSTTDGRVVYLEPSVEVQLVHLGILKNERIRVSKKTVNRKPEWTVERVPKPSAHRSRSTLNPAEVQKLAQPAADILNGAAELDGPNSRNGDEPTLTRLEYSLRTALTAAVTAEKFSREIGHAVVFDKNDIVKMGLTLAINASREGRL